jgi:hypothetical protein
MEGGRLDNGTLVQPPGTARSRDYEFGVIGFTLNEKNKGEGVIKDK